MSRIDELVAERCPGGVSFQRVKDIARIRNGKDYKAFDMGDVPVYGTGGIITWIDTSCYDEPSVLIPRKGSLDKLYYVDRPFWTVDTIFYTEIYPQMTPKFLFYYLQTQHLEDLNQAGGVPSLTQRVLNDLRVPVPPLEVQREIVRILDTFTELEAELETELEAELEARGQQYAHYRDHLVESTAPRDAWVCMGEVGEFVRGRRFTKRDIVESGIPSIHYGEIYTHYGVATSTTLTEVRSDLAGQLRFADPGNVVVAAVGETVADVGKAVAWLGEEPVAIHDDTFMFREHQMNPTFVSYFFQTAAFHDQKEKYVARAKVKRLSGASLAEIQMPTPPLEVQARVVAALGSFDALVNDLSVGLPAELAARRKQYEYYRDRLLTFEEAKP